MSTKVSSDGQESPSVHPRSSEDSERSRGRMLTAFFSKMKLLDPSQRRAKQAEMYKLQVPLRRVVYRRLLSELNTAQQKGCSLMQVIDDLKARAGRDPEAALLLRDIWEVASVTEAAIANRLPNETMQALTAAAERLLKKPFGGEEVLF